MASRKRTTPLGSSSSREGDLARAAIKALRELGYECIRVNSGKRKLAGGGWSNDARKGTPDWMVVAPYCWIEFKDREKVNPDQRQWHAWAARCNVPVIVARSVADAVSGIRRLHRELPYWEILSTKD